MNKKDVKSILISMRTPQNEEYVNYLLGKVDAKDESDIQKACADLGDDEENIREFLKKTIEEKQKNRGEEHSPINEMFSYGVSGNCIHLHLPIDLHDSFSENGISKTIDLVMLYLLDAIDRIKQLKDDGYYKFKDKNTIYMISPVLIKKVMNFLEDLDFTTHSYNRKQLNDLRFVEKTPEAQLAINIFGKDKSVGTATIDIERIETEKWQEKKRKKIEEIEARGVTKEKRKELEVNNS